MNIHKTQWQIFVTFATVHILLSMVAGFCWWYVADNGMRHQASSNAQSIARVLSQGGFTLNEKILQRMQDLSSYRFELKQTTTGTATSAHGTIYGTIEVPLTHSAQFTHPRSVVVHYLNDSNKKILQEIIWTSVLLVLAGTLCFLPAAWFLAKRFARPLEELSQAAQRIGDGNWDAQVHSTGTSESKKLGTHIENMRLQLQRLDGKHRQAERLATLGTFTATIAHEVRNPLSAVRLLVQMVMREKKDTRLQHVEQELQRLDLIVDELLGFSAGMQINSAACDIHACCVSVVTLLQRQADHADVEIIIHRASQADNMADHRRIQQLLMNLILNALHAIQEQGAEHRGLITIAIHNDGFAVYDSGAGVPEHIRDQLFQAFTSDKTSGTGLGLHLAHAIATAHNAQLSYERTADERSCFRLSGLQSL